MENTLSKINLDCFILFLIYIIDLFLSHKIYICLLRGNITVIGLYDFKGDRFTSYQSKRTYRQISNIKGTWLGNNFVDHSDVVGLSPVAAAPAASSFST